MYKGVGETEAYLKELARYTADLDRDRMEVFIIPSYTSLMTAVHAVNQDVIRLGAQNMCWEDEGQFTGEISPVMLEEIGIRMVMIGHSERRHVFGESNIEENKKVLAALKHGFQTLLCVGETQEEKEYGIAEEVLKMQIKTGFHDASVKNIGNIRVAYEPVWSIGVNGTPATADYAQRIHRVIKETLQELFGEEAERIPVLYGGSVNMGNAAELIGQPDIDGLFVGRAAWNAEQFNRLIRLAQDVKIG